MDTESERRFARLEARLAHVETLLAAMATGSAPSRPPPRVSQPDPPEPAQRPPRPAAPPGAQPTEPPLASPWRDEEPGPALATSILGWGGALALVLAAAYLIRLAIDAGWLTPLRQVGLATIAGLGLIGAGFSLRATSRAYAGLLPAAGIVILFLSVYGGHLYYGFLGAAPAAAAVVVICLLSLWLCRAFESDLYALFAVAGSYSAPFLLSTLRGSPADLLIYFSAWNAVFSAFAVWHGRRLIYLLALYLALIGFDVLAGGLASTEWVSVLVFQTVQLATFGVTTVVFSIHNRRPLNEVAAFAHLPPVLVFYFLQYTQLARHVPEAAPWIAVASLAVVAALYAVARAALKRPLPGGEFLLWSYVALVLVHAGYIESVPKEWAPWVALGLVPVLAAATARLNLKLERTWPAWVGIGGIFVVNYLRVAFDTDLDLVPGRTALAVAYALLLYAGYGFVDARGRDGAGKLLLLYAGHVSAMAAALHLLHLPIVQSAAWGVLALACLGVSLGRHDRLLGQSSLLVFAATAAKVLLYDLSGAPTLARIVSLAVLGVTFYFGGLLYQRLLGEEAAS